MTRSRFARVALVVTAVAGLVAGCTSTDGGHGSSAPVPVSTPVSPPPVSDPVSTPPAPTSAPPSSSSAAPSPSKTKPRPKPKPRPSTSALPPSTSAVPSPSSTSAGPPPGPTSCTAGQLTATGIRGGAYQGREVAGVLFTNSSSTSCTVRGYPYAQLTYHGNPLGRPAKHDPGTVRPILLRPGKSAQAQLTAVTTCQSPISDHISVKVPDTAQSKSVPMQLRGCSLSIAPLEAG